MLQCNMTILVHICIISTIVIMIIRPISISKVPSRNECEQNYFYFLSLHRYCLQQRRLGSLANSIHYSSDFIARLEAQIIDLAVHEYNESHTINGHNEQIFV